MSSSSDDPARRLDAPRRGEPYWQGLDADSQVDVLLRHVPQGGMRRQALATLFSDEVIDRLLRDVPCRMTSLQPFAGDRGRRAPVDLAAVAAGYRPEVRPAVMPAPRPRRLLRSVVRVARDLVSVAVVLSVVFATFAASVFMSRWLAEPTARVAQSNGGRAAGGRTGAGSGDPAHAEFPRGVAAAMAEPSASGRSSDPAGRLEGRGPDGKPSSRADSRADGLATTTDASDANRSEAAGVAEGRIAAQGRVSGGISSFESIAADQPDAVADAARTDLRAAPLPGSGLGPQSGSPGRKALRPAGDSLQVVAVRPSAGRAVPYHRGYDLAFEMTSGEAPFVDPSLTPALSMDRPPLSRRTDSFDRVVHLMAAGGLRRDRFRQAMTDVRVEEVLAAIPPPAAVPAIPPPAAVPARQPAAVPSVRLVGAASISGRRAARLLEVSVTAPASSSRATGDLLFVLDASAAAGAEEAWPAICRGVEDSVRRLAPSASVTVVVVTERPEVIVKNAAARDVLELRQRLAAIRPRGGGDLHGALAMARGLLAPKGASARCVVVAHAGSIARAERDGDPSLAAWRRSQQLARDGDASTNEHAGESVEPRGDAHVPPSIEVVEIDAVSGATGEAAGRIGVSLLDGVGIDSMLIRRSIVVAALEDEAGPTFEGCRLEVAFDPAQVAAYRLVGHRRQVVDMVSSRSSAVDLADGECVRVVYEVVLREKDPRGRAVTPAKETFLAKATCRYRRRGDAAESSIVAGISASQLAVDPEMDDPVGQAVWLAVAVAEQASGSAHIESLQRLRDALRHRFDRVGTASAGSAGEDTQAETSSILRQLRGIWTHL